MAADFDFYPYVSNDGETRKLKLAVTSALAQTTTASPGGTYTVDGSAIASSNRRSLGVHVRGFRCKRTTGTGVNQKSFFTFLPVLLPADWANAAIGDAVTIAGTAYTISRKVAESAN
jgi:hypothetical protein